MNKKFVIRYFQRALRGASVGHSIAALRTLADEYPATRIVIKYLKFAKREKELFEGREEERCMLRKGRKGGRGREGENSKGDAQVRKRENMKREERRDKENDEEEEG